MVRPVLGAQRLIVFHSTTGETGSPVRILITTQIKPSMVLLLNGKPKVSLCLSSQINDIEIIDLHALLSVSCHQPMPAQPPLL